MVVRIQSSGISGQPEILGQLHRLWITVDSHIAISLSLIFHWCYFSLLINDSEVSSILALCPLYLKSWPRGWIPCLWWTRLKLVISPLDPTPTSTSLTWTFKTQPLNPCSQMLAQWCRLSFLCIPMLSTTQGWFKQECTPMRHRCPLVMEEWWWTCRAWVSPTCTRWKVCYTQMGHLHDCYKLPNFFIYCVHHFKRLSMQISGRGWHMLCFRF